MGYRAMVATLHPMDFLATTRHQATAIPCKGVHTTQEQHLHRILLLEADNIHTPARELPLLRTPPLVTSPEEVMGTTTMETITTHRHLIQTLGLITAVTEDQGSTDMAPNHPAISEVMGIEASVVEAAQALHLKAWGLPALVWEHC